MSCRALMPVSICIPADYADKLCDRLRCYMKPVLDGVVPETPADWTPERLGNHYKGKDDFWPSGNGRENPWGKALDDIMFYM